MQLLSLADKTNLSKIIFEFEHQGVFKECLHLTDDLECHGEGMGGGGGLENDFTKIPNCTCINMCFRFSFDKRVTFSTSLC